MEVRRKEKGVGKKEEGRRRKNVCLNVQRATLNLKPKV